MNEGKFLTDLQLVPGDSVRCVETSTGWFTKGKDYKIYMRGSRLTINTDVGEGYVSNVISRFVLHPRTTKGSLKLLAEDGTVLVSKEVEYSVETKYIVVGQEDLFDG